jgi:hypothetical protein
MFALISKLSASRKADSKRAVVRPRRVAMVEMLEDRRLHSVSPGGGDVSSYSWGLSQTGTSGYQQPAQTNIIAVLIGL